MTHTDSDRKLQFEEHTFDISDERPGDEHIDVLSDHTRVMQVFAFKLDDLVQGNAARMRGRLVARAMLDMIENDINTRLEAASIYPSVYAQVGTDFNTDDEIHFGSIIVRTFIGEPVSVSDWKTALTYTRSVIEKASCYTYEHMFRSFGERSGAISLGSQWKRVIVQDSDITVRADVNEMPQETNLLAVRLANFLLDHKELFKASDPRAAHAEFTFNRLSSCRLLTKADVITSFSYMYERHMQSPISGADAKVLEHLLLFFAEEWPFRVTEELLAVYINHVRANDIEIDLSRQADFEMTKQGKQDQYLEMMKMMRESAGEDD